MTVMNGISNSDGTLAEEVHAARREGNSNATATGDLVLYADCNANEPSTWVLDPPVGRHSFRIVVHCREVVLKRSFADEPRTQTAAGLAKAQHCHEP